MEVQRAEEVALVGVQWRLQLVRIVWIKRGLQTKLLQPRALQQQQEAEEEEQPRSRSRPPSNNKRRGKQKGGVN